jgi:hypothetical protein
LQNCDPRIIGEEKQEDPNEAKSQKRNQSGYSGEGGTPFQMNIFVGLKKIWKKSLC